MYDTIIIGAGPAGLTAAIYLLRANKKVLIIEKNGIGGQIASSPLVENYPGFIKISGAELANNLYDQIDNLGGEIVIEEVLSVSKERIVKTDYNEYKAKSIIIATGCHYKTLGLENEEDLIGNGIHFCVSCDGAFYKEKDVAVIGGGNSAVGNALSLSEICNKVYVIQISDRLTAEEKIINLLKTKNNVEIIYNSEVIKYNAFPDLSGITINQKGKQKDINVDGVFLAIGLIPETDFVKDIIETDNDYVKSDDSLTNCEGIFVAGDVRSKNIRQLTTAVSDGTIAAINVLDYLKK